MEVVDFPGYPHRPTPMLSVADVPPPGTGFWPRVAEFALSFHAYEYFGCSHVDNTYERTTRGKCDASDQLAED